MERPRALPACMRTLASRYAEADEALGAVREAEQIPVHQGRLRRSLAPAVFRVSRLGMLGCTGTPRCSELGIS